MDQTLFAISSITLEDFVQESQALRHGEFCRESIVFRRYGNAGERCGLLVFGLVVVKRSHFGRGDDLSFVRRYKQQLFYDISGIINSLNMSVKVGWQCIVDVK